MAAFYLLTTNNAMCHGYDSNKIDAPVKRKVFNFTLCSTIPMLHLDL
ncbi:hypothetical protein T03_17027 [Trichinella britovi]|uniref:Uncharacterized protein n=1 Tax=Trichinella britovi TaxID=45882 RepID=A0A0V1DDW9_TRIBR|nr:hypothetical protein T03_17027 [Trichinella britovi]